MSIECFLLLLRYQLDIAGQGVWRGDPSENHLCRTASSRPCHQLDFLNDFRCVVCSRFCMPRARPETPVFGLGLWLRFHGINQTRVETSSVFASLTHACAGLPFFVAAGAQIHTPQAFWRFSEPLLNNYREQFEVRIDLVPFPTRRVEEYIAISSTLVQDFKMWAPHQSHAFKGVTRLRLPQKIALVGFDSGIETALKNPECVVVILRDFRPAGSPG